MRFWDEISQRLAALSGSATPEEARQALNEFDTRDIQAVRVSEGGGGGGGGGSQPHLIGPFTVSFDDPGIATDGAVITALDAGTIVLAVFGVLVEAWDGGTETLSIQLGGDDYGPPDDDYATITNINVASVTNFSGGAGFAHQLASESAGIVTLVSGGGVLTTAGAILVYAPVGTPTQGQLTLYALINTAS